MKRGLILLALVTTAAAAAPQAATAQSCNKVYRYSLTVTGEKTVSETWLPGQSKTGPFGFSYRYEVRYPKVRVRLRGCRGKNLTGSIGRGTGRLVSYDWFDRTRDVRDVRGGPGPCAFKASLGGFRARGTFTADVLPGAGGIFNLSTAITDRESARLEQALEKRRAAACADGNETSLHELSVFGPVFRRGIRVPGGILFPPRLSFGGTLNLERTNGRAPSLARRVAAGRAVSFSKSATDGGSITEVRAVGKGKVSIRLRRR